MSISDLFPDFVKNYGKTHTFFEPIGYLASKETVCCVSGKVKH